LILGFELKNDALKSWAEQELNGYADKESLPPYRTARGQALGLFLGGFGAEIRNQPIPASVLDPKHRSWATEINLSGVKNSEFAVAQGFVAGLSNRVFRFLQFEMAVPCKSDS
jgi:hypothetical protein